MLFSQRLLRGVFFVELEHAKRLVNFAVDELCCLFLKGYLSCEDILLILMLLAVILTSTLLELRISLLCYKGYL